MKRLLQLAALALSSPGALWAQPKVPENTVFKPTFLPANEGGFSGGTAFAAKIPGHEQPLLVTCHHLFGPATGLDTQMSAEDVEKNILAVACVSMSNPSSVVLTSRYIKVAGARAFDDDGSEKDLALFDFPQSTKALTLATKPAKPGDKVWLLARLRGADRLTFIPAVVSFADAKDINYVYEKNDLKLAGTSGAPVLSESGEVIAINLGGGPDKGRLVGIGNPAASIFVALPKKN